MLSIIIPTRNRAELLQKALESLKNQTLNANQFEVLVVDNGSTDNTVEVCQRFQGKLQKFRYFYEDTPGLHIGRHKGYEEACGDILVYIDDDIEALPGWLEAIQDCFSNPQVALVGGNILPSYLETPPEWLSKLWKKSRIFNGNAIAALSLIQLPEGQYEISPLYIWGCNFSVRRNIVKRAGGFHPDGMPQELIRFRGDGETHISQYILDNNYCCLFDSRASVYHAVTPERMTMDYFERRAFNQGISNSYAQLRAQGGSNHATKSPVKPFASRLIHSLKNRVKNLLSYDSTLIQLERMIRKGYKEGYSYHQHAYRSDPTVREWVHRTHYFGGSS